MTIDTFPPGPIAQAGAPGARQSAALGPTIRDQLVWAAMFPLALFGLLAMLVIASSLYELTLNLALQRDTAQTLAMATRLSQASPGGSLPDDTQWAGARLSLGLSAADRQYLVDREGNILLHNGPGPFAPDVRADADLWALIQAGQLHSLLLESPALGDQAIISFAPLPGTPWGLVREEAWNSIMAPAYYYEAALIGLLALGIIFSVVMLSASIRRTLRPMTSLASRAGQVIPGSTFRPLPEEGPVELRALISAFNQMVIRLAEQQSAVRQYAQKALLSQEEERQRLSHELHDGTVQDLVGLVQRVELCSNEMERDATLGRRRLGELETLAKQTLADVRRISNALRPSILQDLGLSAAAQTLCADLEQQMPGLRCDYQVTGVQRRLPPDVELAVFRVVQEALSNVRKHAGHATCAQVELTFGEADLTVVIEDTGPGLLPTDLRALVRTGHLGLAGMYERARLFGGKLDVASTPGAGARIALQLPYPQDLIAQAD